MRHFNHENTALRVLFNLKLTDEEQKSFMQLKAAI